MISCVYCLPNKMIRSLFFPFDAIEYFCFYSKLVTKTMIKPDRKFILFIHFLNFYHFAQTCNMVYFATTKLNYLDHVIYFDGFFFLIPKQSSNLTGLLAEIVFIVYSNNIMLFDVKFSLNNILRKLLIEQKLPNCFNKKYYYNKKMIAKSIRNRYIRLYHLFSTFIITSGLFITNLFHK